MNTYRCRKPARALAAVGAATALIAAALALAGANTALAQDAQNTEECEITDLGTLGNSVESVLTATGRWTTEDCDSRFRSGSDAHTYRFHVEEAGRIRIGLASAEADSYLYLLAEDGRRIIDNDDSGSRLDARVERDLGPGTYLVEVTTVGGRDRGPADFTLTVGRVDGCDFVVLGVLEPGPGLTASGSWSLETCGSRFVSSHPAHSYAFSLAEAARVRIDLESESGDAVLSLASLQGGIVGANDDGGERGNARIEQYLQAGVYFIEATTYLERDYQPLQADFTLTVRLVDEEALQQSTRLKIEEVRTPAEVVAGDRFPVDFRVGNVGGGALPDDGSAAYIYVIYFAERRRMVDVIGPVSGIWDARVAYHTGDGTASSSSTTIDDVTPFEARFTQPGPSWLFVGVFTDDADGNEIGWHGLWHNLTVHSGPTFDPVGVSVGVRKYTVAAESDDQGRVTTSVTWDHDPDAEIDPWDRARAAYAAGVQTQLLEGIFERPAIAELPEGSHRDPVAVENPSSSTLLEAFGQQYASSLNESGLADAWMAREAINPLSIEDMLLEAAEATSTRYASMADGWRSLLRRIQGRDVLSFKEAVGVHSQLAYAESIVAPAAAAGDIVAAARAAEEGWDDPDVAAMMAEATGCRPGPNVLRAALEAAGAADIDDLLALDAELRSLRPVHGLAVDNALCAAEGADVAASRFLQRLSLARSTELRDALGLVPPPAPAPEPEPHRLRIIARLGDDGLLEQGVELAGGEQILPEERFLSVSGRLDAWQESGEVEVQGNSIGRIQARRLADGRIEIGFVSADGSQITPNIAYVPAGATAGVWFYSSEITVPAASTMDDGG